MPITHRNRFLKLVAPVLTPIVVFAAILLLAPQARLAAGPLTSVQELPQDKFDQYLAGTLPPYPWTRPAAPAPGIDLSLQPTGESPFIGNTATGKGLVMNDTSQTAGNGDGIGCTFLPPPKDRLFLGFDFELAPSPSDLTLGCNLTDDKGSGLTLTMDAAQGLAAVTKSGPQRLISLSAGQWYHLGVLILPNGTASFTLTPYAPHYQSVEIGSAQLDPSTVYTSLKFFSPAPDSQTGSWTIDNICMAGDVGAPRAGWWPFDQAPIQTLRATKKKVFVYYFPIFDIAHSDEDPSLSWYTRGIFNPTMTRSDRIDAGTELLFNPLPWPPMDHGLSSDEMLEREMEEEVRLARQMGVDGFFVDFQAFPKPVGGELEFNRRAFALMDAAAKVDPTFVIIPAVYGPDQETPGSAQAYAESPVMKRIEQEPSLYKLPDGRMVLSSWYPERYSVDWWRTALDTMRKDGQSVAFVGQFNSTDKLKDFAPLCYGMADWGPRSPVPYNWAGRIRALTAGTTPPLSVSPVAAQEVRTRGCVYWESCNFSTLRNFWQSAIDNNADWVFINTWSDFTEQAQEPARFIGYVPFDLNSYYTQWYKTGVQPRIVRDVLYYCYRIQHTDTPHNHGKDWSLMNTAFQTRNEIELLAFLKKPGLLQITVDGQVYSQSAPVGITSFTVPLPPGKQFTPTFTLRRNGQVVVSRPGLYTVLGKVEYPNFLYHFGVIAANEPKE